MDNLQELFNIFSYKIDNCNNLLDCVKDLVNYNGVDWQKYIVKNNNYHKEIIYCNDKIEIYIITWMPNASTRIHDHPNKGCLVKVLEGELTETEFINRENLELHSYTSCNNIFYNNTNILKKNDIGFKIKNEIYIK